jgi:hypothetical protein
MLYYATPVTLPQQSSCTTSVLLPLIQQFPIMILILIHQSIMMLQKSTYYDTNTTAIPQIRYLSDTNSYYRTTDTRHMLQTETIPPILTDNNIQKIIYIHLNKGLYATIPTDTIDDTVQPIISQNKQTINRYATLRPTPTEAHRRRIKL